MLSFHVLPQTTFVRKKFRAIFARDFDLPRNSSNFDCISRHIGMDFDLVPFQFKCRAEFFFTLVAIPPVSRVHSQNVIVDNFLRGVVLAANVALESSILIFLNKGHAVIDA